MRRLLLVEPLGRGARHEVGAHLGHDLRVLLPHRLAQHVGLRQREAGQRLRDQHHLFLIGDDAVGVAEDRFELLEVVLDLLGALLPRDVVVHHARLQRAGTIERVERDQVVEAIGSRLAQQLAHAGRLELEDAERGALLEHLVGLRVVQRHVVDVEHDILGPLDLLERVVDERERAQPQEVHLQQADTLDLLHVPLGDDFVPRPLVERRVVGDRTGRDDDAGGVDGGVPRHALEAAADVEDLLDPRVLGRHVLERRDSRPAPCRASCRAPAGICLAMLLTSANGMSSARPTSRTTAFAFIVPKVMICATFSRPYLRVT